MQFTWHHIEQKHVFPDAIPPKTEACDYFIHAERLEFGLDARAWNRMRKFVKKEQNINVAQYNSFDRYFSLPMPNGILILYTYRKFSSCDFPPVVTVTLIRCACDSLKMSILNTDVDKIERTISRNEKKITSKPNSTIALVSEWWVIWMEGCSTMLSIYLIKFTNFFALHFNYISKIFEILKNAHNSEEL